MRGKLSDEEIRAYAWRITPAYAGKTAKKTLRRRKRKDHPRVCGENPVNFRREGILAGITPAYAGKTRRAQGFLRKIQDHPRVCGENFFVIVFEILQKGSPPRMRGKH